MNVSTYYIVVTSDGKEVRHGCERSARESQAFLQRAGIACEVYREIWQRKSGYLGGSRVSMTLV